MVVFSKEPGRRHDIVGRDRKRSPDLRRLTRETVGAIPHDLAHAAVEEALGLNDGFWAAVDLGVVFEDFRLLEPARHHRAGLEAGADLADSAALSRTLDLEHPWRSASTILPLAPSSQGARS